MLPEICPRYDHRRPQRWASLGDDRLMPMARSERSVQVWPGYMLPHCKALKHLPKILLPDCRLHTNTGYVTSSIPILGRQTHNHRNFTPPNTLTASLQRLPYQLVPAGVGDRATHTAYEVIYEICSILLLNYQFSWDWEYFTNAQHLETPVFWEIKKQASLERQKLPPPSYATRLSRCVFVCGQRISPKHLMMKGSLGRPSALQTISHSLTCGFCCSK